eukprot:81799_1
MAELDSVPIDNIETLTEIDESNDIDNYDTKMSSKSNIYGMLLICFSVFILQTNMCVVKYVNASLIQMVWYRTGVSFLICSTWWYFKTPSTHLNDTWYVSGPNRINTWIRGACYHWAIIFLWKGLHDIPSGDTICIFLLNPVLTALLGHFYLKDSLPKTFIATLFGCTLSTLIISQPSFIMQYIDKDNQYEPLNVTAICSILLGVLTYSTAAVLTRQAQTIHWLQVEVVSTFQSVCIWCPMLYVLEVVDVLHLGGDVFGMEEIHLHVIGIAIGIGSVVAMGCYIVGYQIGNTTKVTWMEYTDTLYGYMYQALLFHDMPNQWECIGCVLLIAFSTLPLVEEIIRYRTSINQVVQYHVVRNEDSETDLSVNSN